MRSWFKQLEKAYKKVRIDEQDKANEIILNALDKINKLNKEVLKNA